MADTSTALDLSRPSSSARSDVSFATAVSHRTADPSFHDVPRALLGELHSTRQLLRLNSSTTYHTENDAAIQSRLLHELKHRSQSDQSGFTLLGEDHGFPNELEAEMLHLREELQQERRQREESIGQAESKIESLTAKNASLSQQLEARHEQEAKLAALTEEKTRLAQELEAEREQRTKAETLTQENADLSRELEVKREQLSTMDTLVQQKADLAHQLEKFSGQEDRLTALTTENINLTEQLKQHQSQAEKLNILAQEKSQLMQQLETQREDKEMIDSLTKETATLLQELEAEKKNADASHVAEESARSDQKTAQHQVEDRNAQIAELLSTIATLKQQHFTLRQSTPGSSTVTAEAEAKIASLEEKHRTATEHIAQLNATNTAREGAMQQRYTDLEARLEPLQAGMLAAQMRVEQLEDGFLDNEIRRRDLLDQVEQQKQLLAQANLDIASHGDEVSRLVREHQAAANERDEFKSLLTDALACTSELEQKVQIAQSRASRAEASSRASGSTKASDDKLTGELAERNEELAEIRVQVLSMQGQIAQSQQRATQAEAQLEQSQNDARNKLSERESNLADLREQLVSLQKTHAETVAQLVAGKQNNITSTAEPATEKDKQYKLAVEEAVAAANLSSGAEIASIRHNHASEKEAMQREFEHAMKEKIAQLEDKHEVTLAAALADADEDMEERLRDQARAHTAKLEHLQVNVNAELVALQAQLEEAEALRRAQMQNAETENQQALEKMHEAVQTAEQAVVDMSSRHDAMAGELAAMQARLDAEMITHAEAERALADMRKKHRASVGDRKADDDTKEALQRKLAALQGEFDALSNQHEALAASSNVTSNDVALAQLNGETPGEQGASGELNKLRQQNSELSRQNGFLVKELESTMARFAQSQSRPARNDASVQTEVVQERSTPSNKRSSLRNSYRASNGSRLQYRPSVKTDRAMKTRSLDDYLRRARAEPSELASVISANEALFAMKVQEHVGDLKSVKDQLADEFQQKFDSLLFEKDEMEKTVSAKSAAEFAKERGDLFASYGANGEESAHDFSTSTRRALKDAEGRLVADFDRRVMKRKSQIALKHMADMQILTDDYDRKVAELLNDRTREDEASTGRNNTAKANGVDNKLRSIVANGTTAENGTLSSAVETLTPDTRTPKSYLPKRVLVSNPRTPASIPRAVPFSGRVGLELSTHTRSPSSLRSTPEVYTPSQARTVVRGNSPSIPSTATTPISAADSVHNNEIHLTASQIPEIDEQDFGTLGKVMPMRKGELLRQTPRNLTATDKKRSMRHSSGAIYWQMQKVR